MAGRWEKYSSALTKVESMARSHAPSAIRTLAAIMCGENQPAAARVRAAEILLDRGFGKVGEVVLPEAEGGRDRVVRIIQEIVHTHQAHNLGAPHTGVHTA